MNENELFEKWRTTEGDAHEEVERELVKTLRSHAIALCWNFLGEIPYEVVDTAVMQAICFSGGFRGDSKFSTYYWHLVHNLCQSYLRKKISRRRHEVALPEDAADTIACVSEEPISTIEETITTLSPFDQEIVRLKREGYSEQEIGRMLDTNYHSINTRWQRLKKVLGNKLRVSS